MQKEISPALMAAVVVIVVLIVAVVGWKLFLAKPSVDKNAAPAQNQSQEQMMRMRQSEQQAAQGGR